MAVQQDVAVRAVARVNLAAIERNAARMRRELGAGSARARRAAGAVRGRQGRRLRPRRRAQRARRARRRRDVARRRRGRRGGRAARGRDPTRRSSSWARCRRRELDVALGADADVVAWDEAFVAAVAARGGGAVHVKLDTGMGRLGTRDPAAATRVAEAAAATDGVRLAGAMTHFATADERGDAFFAEQLERFAAWALPLKAAHPAIVLHAANSAGDAARPGRALRHGPRRRRALRPRSVRRGRRRARARAGARAALLRRRRSRRSRRARAPATGGASSRRRRRTPRPCRSGTATACGAR